MNSPFILMYFKSFLFKFLPKFTKNTWYQKSIHSHLKVFSSQNEYNHIS